MFDNLLSAEDLIKQYGNDVFKPQQQPTQQRTPEWYEVRRTRFTASEIWKLWGSAGADVTYVKSKVASILCRSDAFEDGGYKGETVQRGIDLEAAAAAAFAQRIGMELLEVDFETIEGFEDFAGGSTDRIALDGSFIVEIKCPTTPTHLDRIAWVKTPADLKKSKTDFKYYVQMQMCMWAYNVEKCFFVSFDDRLADEKLHLWSLLVPRDEDFIQNELKPRLQKAVALLTDMLARIQVHQNAVTL